ncbi:hypothetical protein CONPUDRAFT_142596 [Coniophora puteana RWD-64-598 SS2]|uniref:C2 domain-containing protein n=1 Tax=Coniophora puteana (strain RWD-64-598) TaxID=741705 RepID=A0A5M3MYL6_CONPW|nr:uncharacterized protein CONPUDRAFT_142596 [Coniophora puteana RWD-64-598 SS2]EIW84232.1 hypothetical protein CONPUDRAFT_142596 [Coniophora puteana RWD-64-598 SS2]
MAKEIGTLVVVVLKARHLHQPTFYKQDPYAKVELVGTTQRTKVDPKGGQHPTWDEELRFPVLQDDNDKNRTLEISVFADAPKKKDPLLGVGKVNVRDTLQSGEFDDWIPLETETGGQRGEIYLEMTYYANAPPPLQRRPSKLNPSERLAPPSLGATPPGASRLAALRGQTQPQNTAPPKAGRQTSPNSRPVLAKNEGLPASLLPAAGHPGGTSPPRVGHRHEELPPLPEEKDALPVSGRGAGKPAHLPTILRPGRKPGAGHGGHPSSLTAEALRPGHSGQSTTPGLYQSPPSQTPELITVDPYGTSYRAPSVYPPSPYDVGAGSAPPNDPYGTSYPPAPYPISDADPYGTTPVPAPTGPLSFPVPTINPPASEPSPPSQGYGTPYQDQGYRAATSQYGQNGYPGQYPPSTAHSRGNSPMPLTHTPVSAPHSQGSLPPPSLSPQYRNASPALPGAYPVYNDQSTPSEPDRANNPRYQAPLPLPPGAQEEENRKREEERRKQEEEHARHEAEEHARREEEERQQREEEERQQREESERMRREVEQRMREEEEQRQREEEERRKREEEEAARRKAEEDEARRKAEEARLQAEEEARRRAEEEARRRAEEEARIKAEEEARKKAEEEGRRKVAEERKRAEEEAERKWQEERKRIIEAEQKRKEERRRQEEADEAFARAQWEAEQAERRRIEEADEAFARQAQEEMEREMQASEERRRQEDADMEVARREQEREEALERERAERERQSQTDSEFARRLEAQFNVDGGSDHAPTLPRR